MPRQHSASLAAALSPAPAKMAALIQKITEEGGFAFVGSLEKAAAGDPTAVEAAREMAWEQLHAGPWHSVVPAWRDAYAATCLVSAGFQADHGDIKESLRILDLGLIMGGMMFRDDLEKGVKLVSERSDRKGGFCMQRLKDENGSNSSEVGKNYLCDEWKQELITFSEFLKRTISPESCKADTTYLAQHPLFDQVQGLRNDIIVPDYCFTGGGEMQSINAWFGPAGTVTPLHHDPHHNLLAQVVGRKYVRLYPAFVSAELYPHTETMLCNSSQVDLDRIDLEKFPKFEGLEFVDCILEEGDMLYIPPKWWHYVRSLSPSFSVSFWWAT